MEGKAKKKKKKKRKKKTAKAEAATGILAVPGPDSRASPSFFTDMGIDQRAAEHLSKHLSAEDQAKIKEMGEAKLKQHGVPEQRGEPEPQSRLAAAARSRSPRPRGYQLPRESQAVHCDEIIIPRIRCLFLMCVIK